ncbi:glycoside hydrolase family 2 TIM barrel-domain containing protein [Plebeiibacterium marinum]|uniref:Beta-galactosidase n=1 Tax=Plebeiibacterium marinum TaxID=2992111 RepID=A0AAE3MGL6_9BACT|nr:glycoside hydrolase family 2 TIM barrel-domain containing protein [Plebeiobacterium marinum]MCW3807121.1 DUF4981 domain-containing protein [Plebeiobacterium marinum]
MKGRLFAVGLFLMGLICGLCDLTAQVLIPNSSTKDKVLLNGIWKFKYLNSIELKEDSVFCLTDVVDTDWVDIKVPGNWELQGFAKPYYGKELQEGTGLYRTSFNVPQEWKGNSIHIAFDGVLYGYKFWINGKYVGKYNSAFNRKSFDISSFVESGTKVELAVEVSTRSRGWAFDTNDCWSLSGIFRDVTLYSVPETHLKDLTITTHVDGSNADVNVEALIATNKVKKNQKVYLKLQDANGKIVTTAEMNGLSNIDRLDSIPYQQVLKLDKANLWTSETPYLYNLKVEVTEGKKVLQTYNQKVGIREITWENGVYKINGKVVKLRGINHHDLSPVNGRSMTEEEMLEDLKLIREGNANFIRASHYPPHPRFMELCDSLGFYIIDEVPFGFGDKHLYKDEYLSDLKERARATIARDKNHPCVIAWSVGNENPLTKICLETGRYVKSLDPTRPYSFPQVGSYFRKICDTIPKEIDILSPHYPVAAHLKSYSKKFKRPMIITEYAHALGLDADRIESLWEIMYSNPVFAGGAVWHLYDQGILVKSDTAINADEFTTSVWIDSTTCYDNYGNKGADGVMYANRVPQVDYYEMRKVYTPVKALDDTLHLKRDQKNEVTLGLSNRYNFTNLDQIVCNWELLADTSILSKGNLSLKGEPHDTSYVSMDIALPKELNSSFYALKLTFTDTKHYSFYEKTYPIVIEDFDKNLTRLFDVKSDKEGRNDEKLSIIDVQNNQIQLQNASSDPLIIKGLLARMGRKTTMSEITIIEKKREGNCPLWNPYLLHPQNEELELNLPNKKVINYSFERVDVKGQFIDGQVTYTLNNDGSIEVSYTLTPRDAEGIALDLGMSFIIPNRLSEFRWVGKGPYPAYPGKSRLSEFGIYHMNSQDLNYQGNRQEVELALFTDSLGCGLALISDKDNIAVERSQKGIVVSHNAKVSGRFNKNSTPEQKIRVENCKQIRGEFTIIPLENNWSESLQKIFGQPKNVQEPFAPFFNSYDQ